jgi:hypothetical protein
MGRIWVRELTGGLDVRRMAATTSGGVLIKGEDGHINEGGEFEKRPAFVSSYTLPEGTVELAHTTTGLLVFGHDTEPMGMPSGVGYEQLVHPDTSSLALTRVLSYDLYGGLVYAVGQFEDGSIHHFYDGAVVDDWYDGRARASFTVTGGSVTPAVAATGSFDVTGGTNGVGNQITSVKVDGIDVLTGPIAHTGTNSTTATAIASAINSLSSSPDYTAAAVGDTVTITAALTGTAANGKALAIVVGGDATVGNISNMAGGAATITSSVDNITVNGVSIIDTPVDWTTSHEDTAAAIAAEINSYTSSPDYEATAVGARVNIIAEDAGTGPNGFAVAFTLADGMVFDPTSTTMAGGADSDAYVPGEFVRTIGSKMYSTSDGRMHFSGIRAPTQWTTDAVGAGFIDMSQEASAFEELTGLADYQGFVAVFAANGVMIWYVDPDPDLYAKRQVLRNTGTPYPGSITEFGDSDLFYLANSGCRSLKARDSSNAAATTDIGSPIDKLIRAKLRTMSAEERSRIRGLINPADGRFWLIMGDTIYVFSFFPNSKVSAWTTYTASYLSSGVRTDFEIENAVVLGDKVFVRSGNTIYSFGGLDDEPTYDGTIAKAHLPFLSADNPTQFKGWDGFDAAVEGTWSAYIAPVVKDASIREQAANVAGVTFDEHRYSLTGQSTHVSLQFESQGETAAKVSSAVLHYVGGEDS